MADVPQSYENHTRWHAPFHFFVAPVLLTNVVVAAVQLVRDPGLDRGWWLVVSLALLALAGVAATPVVRGWSALSLAERVTGFVPAGVMLAESALAATIVLRPFS